MDNANAAVSAPSHPETLGHRDLIYRAGGSGKVSESLSPPVDRNTVKAWAFNDSIPGPYWQAFADAKLATLEELAAAAEAKRRAAARGNSEQAPQ